MGGEQGRWRGGGGGALALEEKLRSLSEVYGDDFASAITLTSWSVWKA